MHALRHRASAAAPELGFALATGALTLGGVLAFSLSAYAFGPAVLPVALAAAGFVALASARPAWGVAGALLAIPLELLEVDVLTGQVSPSQGALAVVAVLWLARFIIKPETVAGPRLRDWPVLLLLAAMAAGLFVATDVTATARVLVSFVILYLVYLQIQSFSVGELRLVVAGLIVGAGVLGLVGGIGFLGSGEVGLASGTGSDRAAGTFDHPNTFASALTVALLPAIALVIVDAKRHLWMAVPIAGALAGLAFSLSRGGITAFAAGLLLLLLWRRARWLALAAASIVAALTLAGANPLAESDEVETVRERLSTVSAAALEQNDRPRIWATAVEVAAENPVVGIGMVQFRHEAARRGLFGAGGGPFLNAHNIFLGFAAETGLFGLAGFVAFLAQVAARGVRALRGAEPGLRLALAMGLLAALLAYLVQGMTVVQMTTPLVAALFFVVAGMLTALHEQAPPEAPARPS